MFKLKIKFTEKPSRLKEVLERRAKAIEKSDQKRKEEEMKKEIEAMKSYISIIVQTETPDFEDTFEAMKKKAAKEMQLRKEMEAKLGSNVLSVALKRACMSSATGLTC